MNFLQKLPVSHTYGDECSVLADGSTIRGPLAHESQVTRQTRVLFHDRVTVAHLDKRTMVYVTTPDWTLLQNDWPFFQEGTFDFVKLQEQFQSVFRMTLASLLADNSKTKMNLRIWPLVSRKVVEPRVLQQFSFAQASALVACLQEQASETSLIESIAIADFLDIPAESIVQFFRNEPLRVPIQAMHKDSMWDTSKMQTEIVSSDAFCIPGMHPNSLEATLSQDTNQRDVFGRPWIVREIGTQVYSTFNGWPSLSMSSEKRQNKSLDASVYRNVSNRECADTSAKTHG